MRWQQQLAEKRKAETRVEFVDTFDNTRASAKVSVEIARRVEALRERALAGDDRAYERLRRLERFV